MATRDATRTYGSADVEAETNTHDVDLIVVGSRSTASSMSGFTTMTGTDERWEGIEAGVVHRNGRSTGEAWLLDMAKMWALYV
jgi:hypothetical protein